MLRHAFALRGAKQRPNVWGRALVCTASSGSSSGAASSTPPPPQGLLPGPPLGPVLGHYDALVGGGHLRFDASQRILAQRLAGLQGSLAAYNPPAPPPLGSPPPPAGEVGGTAAPTATPRGIYIWGDVGTGKR